MKKTIIIITGDLVVDSIIWLTSGWVSSKISDLKAVEKQQESMIVRQDSTTEQKTKTKPKFKHPVYDLSPKTYWYDPETTIELYESKTLTE